MNRSNTINAKLLDIGGVMMAIIDLYGNWVWYVFAEDRSVMLRLFGWAIGV